MGLVTCPDCGRDVSEQAAACPQCGRPMGSARVKTSEDSVLTRNRGCSDIVVFSFLGVVLLLALAFALI